MNGLQKHWIIIFLLLFVYFQASSQIQQEAKETIDSLYIEEVENYIGPDKVLHAEPLFIDLIRDLGARKGEKEWNVGLGLTDDGDYDKYTALVEYEFAPINRLGLEVELPFSLYFSNTHDSEAPSSKLNSVKLAAQYSFFVSERLKLSMAAGYIQEFELKEFNRYKHGRIFTGNVYNPFFVIAKRWGSNFHNLIYTGPAFMHHFGSEKVEPIWQINTNFHYMIPGTRNFVGLEFNKSIFHGDFDMIIRPQMRVGITEQLLIGIVTGIPISKKTERFSTFLRLIYEPGHKKAR